MGSFNNKGSVYRLLMVKRKVKTVYYVNHFNTVGFVGSVSFSTLCSAYKYFIQLKSTKKHKSFNNPNQVSLW
jgi:glutamate formiminotransferase